MLPLTLATCAASIEEIIAMKIDVISIGGREKDFWDLHELKDEFTIDEVFALHRKKDEYIHNRELYQDDLIFSPKVAGKHIIKGASFFSVLCF